MDLLLLVFINGVLKCSATQFRIFLGAFTGAIFATLSLFILSLPYFLWILITYGVTGILMVKVSFKMNGYIAFLKATGLLFGGIMLFGGMLTWLSVQIPIIHAYGYSMLGVLGIGSFFCLFILRIIKKISNKRKNHVFEVVLTNQGKNIETNGLWDTGNRLTEPVTGKSVSVIEKQILDKLLDERNEMYFLYIPYHAVGTTRGYLKGYCIEEMRIRKEYGEIRIKNPVLGLYEGQIQKEGKYHMILAEDIVNQKN